MKQAACSVLLSTILTGHLYAQTERESIAQQPDQVQISSEAIGGPRTYTPQQLLALILPDDGNLRLRLVVGFNVGLGAAIWGTVVLAATCPACAVATGIAAFVCFVAAAGTLAADDQPDSLLYLAPGQQLSRKLGYVGF